jgi:midasin (ATPase involved in ribosome maturation)
MRKIIPFIASDFKKDKIWLRRTKPNKREFQILVALGKWVREAVPYVFLVQRKLLQ